MMKKVVILGSTGTIGRKAIDVIREHSDRVAVSMLVANRDWKTLKQQIDEFKPELAILSDYKSYLELKKHSEDTKTEIKYGTEAIKEGLYRYKKDIILSAFSGTAGILPTYWAVENGSYIALANKESLVSAGELIMPLAKKTGATIIPVDSEHSAIFQLFSQKNKKALKKIILPASGGPFFKHSAKRINSITIKDALNHPVWKMGKKITIDSATLANKGLEVIEAHHLFDVSFDKIDVVIHPQCLIHGIIELKDGSCFCHVGEPDMRHPIAYALFYPSRLIKNHLSFSELVKKIEIFDVDRNKFPMLELAYDVGRKGSSYPALFNIADEIAVNAFLEGRISFNEIYTVVYEAVEKHKPFQISSIDSVIEVEKETRAFMKKQLKKRKIKNG